VTTWMTTTTSIREKIFYFMICAKPPKYDPDAPDPEIDPELANGRSANEVIAEYRRYQAALRGSSASSFNFYKNEIVPELDDDLENYSTLPEARPRSKSRRKSSRRSSRSSKSSLSTKSSGSYLRWLVSPWQEKDPNILEQDSRPAAGPPATVVSRTGLESRDEPIDDIKVGEIQVSVPKLSIDKPKPKKQSLTSLNTTENFLSDSIDKSKRRMGRNKKRRRKRTKGSFERDTQWLLQPWQETPDKKSEPTEEERDSFAMFMQELSDMNNVTL